MSKAAHPDWILTESWAVGRDPYNWILYSKGKQVWKPTGYFSSPELLLKSLYGTLLRTAPAGAGILQHVEAVSERVQAAAVVLFRQIRSQADENPTGPVPRAA